MAAHIVPQMQLMHLEQNIIPVSQFFLQTKVLELGHTHQTIALFLCRKSLNILIDVSTSMTELLKIT
jgi:hypothetical protein